MMERSKEGTSQDEEVTLGTDHPWLRQQCMSRAGRNVPSSYTALQLMVLPIYCIVKAPTLGLGKNCHGFVLVWFWPGIFVITVIIHLFIQYISIIWNIHTISGRETH